MSADQPDRDALELERRRSTDPRVRRAAIERWEAEHGESYAENQADAKRTMAGLWRSGE